MEPNLRETVLGVFKAGKASHGCEVMTTEQLSNLLKLLQPGEWSDTQLQQVLVSMGVKESLHFEQFVDWVFGPEIYEVWAGSGCKVTFEEADVMACFNNHSTAVVGICLRAIAGGFIPDFETTSEKAQQYMKECSQIRAAVHPLYYDMFARLLVNPYSWKIFEKFLTSDSSDKVAMAMAIGFRSSFVEANTKQALAAGTRQMVYLGCGLDLKATRLHLPDLKSVEVEQRPILAYKGAAMAANGFLMYPAHFVEGDYLEIDLFAELQRVGIDLAAPTIFVWEGNSMCICVDKSKSLLCQLFEKAPKATIIFDSVAAEGDSARFPGCTDAQGLAASAGAKLQKSVKVYDFALEMLGSEEAIKPFFLNDPERLQAFKNSNEFTYFNVVAKESTA